MKAIVFDSGSLINLSMNGLLYILEELKKEFPVAFLITKAVKYEIIDRPIKIPRFELGALRIQELLSLNILQLPQSLGIEEVSIKNRTYELMEKANHYVKLNGKLIKIVSEAEMSCLALSSLLSEKKIENLIAIDERTTRMLSEKPENLERLMSKKLHQQVTLAQENLEVFKKYKFIRSSELVYVAYKKGLLKIRGPKAIEAVLYATKYQGSSISHDEINILKKL